MKVNLSDENWLQIVTFIKQDNISIESVSETFGVTRKAILTHISIFKELDPCVSSKAVSGAMAVEATEVLWLTTVEYSLLGVKLVGRGLKNVGRVRLPQSVLLELDETAGEVVAVGEVTYLLYPVPETVLWELWRIRPWSGERELRIGDDMFLELLLKRLTYLKNGGDGSWSEIALKNYKPDLVVIRDILLSCEERRKSRAELIRISDGFINC